MSRVSTNLVVMPAGPALVRELAPRDTAGQRMVAALRSLVDAPLPQADSTRDRVSLLLQGYLDALAADHTLVAGIGEPEAAVTHRRVAASALVEKLREIIGVGDFPRHIWALWGWVGFLEAAGRHWVDDGCPADQRWPLIEAALGALEGALGDWRV